MLKNKIQKRSNKKGKNSNKQRKSETKNQSKKGMDKSKQGRISKNIKKEDKKDKKSVEQKTAIEVTSKADEVSKPDSKATMGEDQSKLIFEVKTRLNEITKKFEELLTILIETRKKTEELEKKIVEDKLKWTKTNDDEWEYIEDEITETATKSVTSDFGVSPKSSLDDASVEQVQQNETPAQTSTVIESTKPTINQQIKAKKERPMYMTERIGKAEFEALNDEINELNSGIQTLKYSYGSIIKSLMMMQSRKAKKKMLQAMKMKQKGMADDEVKHQMDDDDGKKTDNGDKFNMDNFLNAATREETFQLLFKEVNPFLILTNFQQVKNTHFEHHTHHTATDRLRKCLF